MSNQDTASFGQKSESRRSFFIIMTLLACGVLIAAALVGADATWDFRNYHLYDPYALLNKSFGVDIAPAHVQTYFSPTMDLFYYSLVRSISSTPLLNIVFSLPHALAVALVFALTCRLLQPETTLEHVILGVLVAISATGAATGSTIATTMSEMLPACVILWALLLLVPRDLVSLPTLPRVFWAGVAFGGACGLKLTMSYATVAFALTLIVVPRRTYADLLTRPVLFGVGVLLGTLALTGYWWAHQWEHYGNPFFPMLNDVFRSPQAALESFVDPTFLPHSIGHALRAPWEWALQLSWSTGESRLRDPRFSLALIAAAIALVQAGFRRPRWQPWPIVFCTVWFVVAFALWRVEFSIFRYLSILELLTGTVMAVAVLPLARQMRINKTLAFASLALLAGCVLVTAYPRVNRTPAGAPLAVEFGPLPPESMVLLLDNEPMAYLAAFADPSVRFIATNDFFMTLDKTNPMQAQVETAIREHRGPIWGLDSPPEQRDRSDRSLERYDLIRGACHNVETNISPLAIRLCKLDRKRATVSKN